MATVSKKNIDSSTTKKMAKKRAGPKKGKARILNEGIVHIKSTFNNTLVSVTDMHGGQLSFSSGGHCGFSGHRKATPYAAQLAAERAAQTARDTYSLKRVVVKLSGPGIPARDSATRALRSVGLEIMSLEDCTRLPHNGCRPPKKRRV